jgi:hypothetical protein
VKLILWFVVYLMTLSVSLSVERAVVGILVVNELVVARKEVVMD